MSATRVCSRATKWCCSAGRAMKRSRPGSGRSASARSRTRLTAVSVHECRGGIWMAERRRRRAAAVAGGVIAGVAGAAYGAERAVARRVRKGPAADAARVLDTPIYVDHTLDTFDRGTIYVVEAGE